jgi:hypothetical protein
VARCLCLFVTWSVVPRPAVRTRVFPQLSPSSPSISAPSCMTWTTKEQLAWLSERIPDWRRSRVEKGSKFLDNTTVEFLKVFPGSLSVEKAQDVSASLPSLCHPLNYVDPED